jgi:predicted aldo/keto reductase-like oxidoreductase
LKTVVASGAVVAASSVGCKSPKEEALAQKEVPTGEMTYRLNNKGEKISILGYGCMRLPTKKVEGTQDETVIDQDMVNRHVDYALEHGVNYFDTSPAYCKGKSEAAMGIALSRHDRNKYYIATKLSNFAKSTWSYKESVKMYHKSFEELQVEYIDYMLLHGIGMGGMENLKARYLDNGVLDFLLKEREVGKIRNLGFSYHGDVECFDYLLAHHDKYKWDFAQIQLNYLDWAHAQQNSKRNRNAELLYNELTSRGIPVVVMEPLLGGRLAKYSAPLSAVMTQYDPEATPAKWAFRFAGTQPNILTVLSGMTYMEHLVENVETFSPFKPLNERELAALERVARLTLNDQSIACNVCSYCMPCPYGLDIPGIFSFWNSVVQEGRLPDNPKDFDFAKSARNFLIEYDRLVPKLRQANRCTTCGKCMPHCPQGLEIAREMRKIDRFVDDLRRKVNA